VTLHSFFEQFPFGLLLTGAALRAVAGHFVQPRGQRPQPAEFYFGSAQLLNSVGVLFAWLTVLTTVRTDKLPLDSACAINMHASADRFLHATLLFSFVMAGDLMTWLSYSRVLGLPRGAEGWARSRTHRGLVALLAITAAVFLLRA